MAADVLTAAALHSSVAASAAVNGRAWCPSAGPPSIPETSQRRGLGIFRTRRGVTLRVSCGAKVVAAAAPGSGKGFGAGGGGGRPKSGGSKKRGVKGPRPEEGDDASVARILRRLDEMEKEEKPEGPTTAEPPSPASSQPAASVKEGADRGEAKGALKGVVMSRLGIDPRAAVRGRVDYAEVEGWEPYMAAAAAATAGGGGAATVTTAADAEDIGNLRLRRFAPGATAASLESAARGKNRVGSGAAAEEEGGGAGAAGAAGATQAGGLYERLVRHLQQAESRGELAVARPKGAPPLPPFERWRFGDRRYLQYLVDLHSVHSAVEAGLSVGGSGGGSSIEATKEVGGLPEKATASAAVPDAAAAAAAATASGDGDGGGSNGAAAALDLFSLELGIYRSAALMSDMTALRGAIEAADADAAADLPSKPTTQTLAFSNYIASLVRTIRSSSSGVSSSSSSSSTTTTTTTMGSSEGGDVASSAAATLPLRSSKPTGQAGTLTEGETARLRLLANLFTVYVAHFTTGMRIGAKAVECVPALRRAAAVRVFRDYPARVKDPLKDFVAAVNAAGEVLREEEVEVLLRELPKAMVKTSMLLSVISVEEKAVESGIVAEVL